MTTSHIPPVFKSICSFFHQDVLEIYTDFDEALEDYIKDFSPDQLVNLTRFLDTLLNGSPNAGQLQAIWNKTDADWYFDDQSLIVFLEKMRELAAIRTGR